MALNDVINSLSDRHNQISIDRLSIISPNLGETKVIMVDKQTKRLHLTSDRALQINAFIRYYSKHNVDCRRPGPCNLLN